MKRFFPIGLIGLGFLLSLGALSWPYLSKAIDGSASSPVPDQIVGLQKTSYISGAEAIAEFENLHGKQFPISSGSIGIYGNQQATLWVAGASSDSVALNMVETMEKKIAQGNTPFKPLEQTQLETRTIYSLEGMGQKHYYFQSKNLVIWLAANPSVADAAIQQILEVYP